MNTPQDRPNTTEQYPRFVSGRWRGFWIQGASRSRTELQLSFADGGVSGVGHDWVGDYSIRGSYDLESGKVAWRKSYLGSHAVAYDGHAETTNGIWGMWSIAAYDKGGFQIWPEEGPANAESLDAEAEQPVDAEAPVADSEVAEPALAP